MDVRGWWPDFAADVDRNPERDADEDEARRRAAETATAGAVGDVFRALRRGAGFRGRGGDADAEAAEAAARLGDERTRRGRRSACFAPTGACLLTLARTPPRTPPPRRSRRARWAATSRAR